MPFTLRAWLIRIILLLFAVCSSTAMAQATPVISSPPSTARPTDEGAGSSSEGPRTHTIQVGLADHKMRPETTQAAIGDTIEFAFYPLNHSVVRADYGYPCIPYEMIGPSRKGFFSGFHPVKDVLEDPPTYRVRVNDLEPILYYCSAPGSCINYGMVGGINLDKKMDIETQIGLAKNATYMLQPGEPFPAEGPTPSNVPTGSPSPSASGPPGSSSNQSSSSGGLSKGAIAGISVAGGLALLLGALLFFCWGRTKSLRDETRRRTGGGQTEAATSGMGEYKAPNAHIQPLPHDQHQQQFAGPGADYRLSGYPAKYNSPPHTPFQDHMTGSPQSGLGFAPQPYSHPGGSPRSPPAPAYYESVHPSRPDHSHTASPDPVEMEARAPGRVNTGNGK